MSPLGLQACVNKLDGALALRKLYKVLYLADDGRCGTNCSWCFSLDLLFPIWKLKTMAISKSKIVFAREVTGVKVYLVVEKH